MLTLSGIIAILSLIWLAEIVVANQIAQRDFGPEPCWFIQEDRPINMPELIAGPHGIYVPNPLRQINRRFVGLGLSDPEVLAPHFAVAALDAKGRPALWGWSYHNMGFWPLSEVKIGGNLTPGTGTFTSGEAIRAACPTLADPINPKRLGR
ncbi:hypothetical protein J3U99_22835 [Brucella pituitosa]|uniref:hypothetical protein n=1 Tax=Brucella pituitosa TaxID=571256 RepID=UPI0020038E5C|nr:hypothetical protein [Brucella pituitosa]MCK4207588.1 hypothetical protein [Brucella pituitosa]